ncbi:ANL_collapsed_G0025130.mRNA.1.CDS.1 [Saccharomyces cerevisiae]|nr:ANL_collapsed_G0025130.mRNA.1.CDS.1 [Saccharomyces cerevisiae]
MEEMYQDKLPPNVKPNETPIFLKVKERSRYDDELVPTQQEEEYKFNMVLSIILSVLLGFYYIYTLHRA